MRDRIIIDIAEAAGTNVASHLADTTDSDVLQLGGGDLAGEDPEPYHVLDRGGFIIVVFDSASVDEPDKQSKGRRSGVIIDHRWYCVVDEETVFVVKSLFEEGRMVEDERLVNCKRFCIFSLPHIYSNKLVVGGTKTCK